MRAKSQNLPSNLIPVINLQHNRPSIAHNPRARLTPHNRIPIYTRIGRVTITWCTVRNMVVRPWIGPRVQVLQLMHYAQENRKRGRFLSRARALCLRAIWPEDIYLSYIYIRWGERVAVHYRVTYTWGLRDMTAGSSMSARSRWAFVIFRDGWLRAWMWFATNFLSRLVVWYMQWKREMENCNYRFEVPTDSSMSTVYYYSVGIDLFLSALLWRP